MAIALDNFVAGNGGSGSSSTTLALAVSGNDRVLIVGTSIHDAAENLNKTITGITYNGVALTEISAVASGIWTGWGGGPTAQGSNQMWYLVNPATGTNNLVVSYSATLEVSEQTDIVAASFTGCDTLDPLGGTGTAGAGTTVTVSVTTERASSILVGWVAWSSFNLDSETGTSINSDARFRMSYESAPTAGANDIAWTFGGSNNGRAGAVELMAPSSFRTKIIIM